MSVPKHRFGASITRRPVKPFVYYGFLLGMLLATQKVVSPLYNTIGER